METISAELLRPLDGDTIGSIRKFDEDDFARLEELGAVKRASGDAKQEPAAQNKKQQAPANKAADVSATASAS